MGLQSTLPTAAGVVGTRIPDSVGVTAHATDRPTADLLDDWDGLVARTPRSDVAQLSAWAAVRAPAGYDTTLLTARCDGVVLGGAQVCLA